MIIRVFVITILTLVMFLILTGFIPEISFTKFKLEFRLDNVIMFIVAIISSIFLTVLAFFEIRGLKSKLRRRESEYTDLKEKYETLEEKIESKEKSAE